MRKPDQPIPTLTALLLALLVCLGGHAQPVDGFERSETWFVLKMGGQKAGYVHTVQDMDGEFLVNTTRTMLTIQRGETAMHIQQGTRFVETVDHQPIESTSTMQFAAMATETRVAYGADKWTVTSTNAGQTTTSEIAPSETDWVTPGEVAVLTEQAIARGDETIELTTLDPSIGTTPVTVTMVRGETADIEVFGKVVQATKWKTTMSVMPGVTMDQWMNAAGVPVRQVVPLLPGMEMEMLLADEQLATAEFDAPEILASTLISPDKPIDNPRQLTRGVFELSAPNLKENLGDTVPNDGYQRTEWIDDNTLRITVDLGEPVTHDAQDIDPAYSTASTMLNWKDEEVARLTREARPDNPGSTLGIAQATRRFVRGHIEEKDLSVGFASASEVARTGQGDCSEHGCLLAAMLRGAGVPSRTVTGVVYVDQFVGQDNVFGFHMWAQAWLVGDDGKGRWVDLDAAAPGEVDGFDATHLAFTTSAMKDGETLNDMVALMPLMSGLEIKVVELDWAE